MLVARSKAVGLTLLAQNLRTREPQHCSKEVAKLARSCFLRTA